MSAYKAPEKGTNLGPKPNKRQRARLAKLADFLEYNAESLTATDTFKMKCYQTINGVPQAKPHPKLGVCGSSACAIGWGATLHPRLEVPKSRFYFYEFSVKAYGIKAYGVDYGGHCGGFNPWNYLFGPSNPDDPKAAAARIRTYLEAIA